MLFSFFYEGVERTLAAATHEAQHKIYITATLAPPFTPQERSYEQGHGPEKEREEEGREVARRKARREEGQESGTILPAATLMIPTVSGSAISG
jgi:hypothetical protein